MGKLKLKKNAFPERIEEILKCAVHWYAKRPDALEFEEHMNGNDVVLGFYANDFDEIDRFYIVKGERALESGSEGTATGVICRRIEDITFLQQIFGDPDWSLMQ